MGGQFRDFGERLAAQRHWPCSQFHRHGHGRTLFGEKPGITATGGQVIFAPGARSAWHTHPAGQVLIVTDGTGWVQEEGGAKREIKPGDVIWTPPGVKHWHGATATNAMRHIAISGMVNGKNVDWLEKVTDEQYQAQ
jgi:quercetin dioxygenase-like cupin family protein